MFRLNKEVEAWCQSIYEAGRKSEAGIEELKDHLYCDIEQLMSEGLSEKQAFVKATERMGHPEDLYKEYVKNRNVFSRLCRIFTHQSEMLSPKQLAVVMAAYVLLFAAITATAKSLWGGTEHYKDVTFFLYSAWLAPLFIYPGFQRSAKSEWACIKRLFTSMKKS